jgi:hypothetical protein
MLALCIILDMDGEEMVPLLLLALMINEESPTIVLSEVDIVLRIYSARRTTNTSNSLFMA